MARKNRYYNSEDRYSGREGRERLDREGSEMMGREEGFANMPQRSFMKPWPSMPYPNDARINDGISGIDSQLKADMRRNKRSTEEKY